MNVQKTLELINYGLIFFYGLFLSAKITYADKQQWQKTGILSIGVLLLVLQILCTLLWDIDTTRRLYPVIVHLPLLTFLVFFCKRPAGIALVSVCTAYLCCQLPRAGKFLVIIFTKQALLGEITYTVLILPIFFLLWCYFAHAAYNAMTDSPQALLLFGSLPVLYYISNYVTIIYSNIQYEYSKMLGEILPTILILFYVAFLTAYRVQLQKRSEIEFTNSMFSVQLKQAETEISTLRKSRLQIAVYQHDMRHHLLMVDNLLAAGQTIQAREYIQKVQGDITSTTPQPLCENELVNLLCSSFMAKAGRMNVRLLVDAKLPKNLSIPDTELCSILSNGLENALHATCAVEEGKREVRLYCAVRFGKLLLEIKNPYVGEIKVQNGLPISDCISHGYGCRSIQTITERHGGLCSFQTENGMFQLQIALPVSCESPLS